MSKLSKLFDKRSKKYNHIYTQSSPKKLLHQEKRLRAVIVEDLVISYLCSSNEQIVVDVGCGMGNILSSLKNKEIQAKMYGFDISKEMISLAKENGHQDINFNLGSVKDITFKANIVLSLGVIGYQKKQTEFLNDLSSNVQDDGYLIFTTANGDSYLRSTRRLLSKLHSLITRKTKGEEFLAMKDKQVENVLIKNGFGLEKKIYITFGLGLFSSSIECSIDRLLFKYFNDMFLGKYLSLSVIYVYKKVKK